MRWPWSKKPQLLPIPPYVAPVREAPARPEDGIVVDEHDTSSADEQDLAALRAAQSRTGMHRAWDRLTGKAKGPPPTDAGGQPPSR